MRIRQLPENLINQIAAGEVIERPFSVVRELVENSIDAGSTNIQINIRDGGKAMIQITDNGCGMDEIDLENCIKRHATSKINGEDLVNISTLGFRGEALASIGSVAKLEIKSCAAIDEAWQISVDGGQVEPIKPCTLDQGTCISVRDLFFNVPARLKFLRSSMAENRAIKEVIQRLALTCPLVGFELILDGKTTLKTLAQNQLNLDPAYRVKEILGKDFVENSVEIDVEKEDISLQGIISTPQYSKATSVNQYLFVNGRPVKDKTLSGALRAAYMDVMARDRHACVCLFLTCPVHFVDMNVHPTKSEVRFIDQGKVRGLIIGSIKEKLSSIGVQTSSHISNYALTSFQTDKPATASDFKSISYAPRPSISRADIHPSANSYKNQTASNFKVAEQTSTFDIIEPSVRASQSIELQQDVQLENNDYILGLAKAQIFENYIIAQANDGLVLIDQHAAHERLVYEKIKTAMIENGVQRQGMLMPEIVDLDPYKAHNLLSAKDQLEKLGLVIEGFGGNSISVQEIPALLGNRVNYQQMIKDLADQIDEDGLLGNALEKKLYNICATMACHSSVRSGRTLGVVEMNQLLRDMESTPNSSQCNHGRPTFIKLKLSDIEKLFERV